MRGVANVGGRKQGAERLGSLPAKLRLDTVARAQPVSAGIAGKREFDGDPHADRADRTLPCTGSASRETRDRKQRASDPRGAVYAIQTVWMLTNSLIP